MRLEAGEKKILVVRKHWLGFVLQTGVIALLIFAPLIVYLFVPDDILQAVFPRGVTGSLGAFLYYAWLLGLWILFFLAWTTYYFDMWIITTKRIVNVDQKTLFHREEISAPLVKVQDISVEKEGVLQTLFGYGRMRIETAGESPNFVIENAASPSRAKEKILAAHLQLLENGSHGYV